MSETEGNRVRLNWKNSPVALSGRSMRCVYMEIVFRDLKHLVISLFYSVLGLVDLFVTVKILESSMIIISPLYAVHLLIMLSFGVTLSILGLPLLLITLFDLLRDLCTLFLVQFDLWFEL